MSTIGQNDVIESRRKYVEAWNDTMIKMWQEQITLLGVLDTHALLDSLTALPIQADGRFYELKLSQEFKEYGIWQEYGVGKEVPRGNSGDIGREKVRQRRRWFSKKYYRSVMMIKEFMAESLGEEFIGIFADALNDSTLKAITQYNRKNHH